MTNWKGSIKKLFVVMSKVVFLFSVLVLIYAATLYILKNISLETSKNILDYIRAIIWPGIVLIVITVFRSNLAQLIERLEEGENPIFGKWKASHSEQPILQQEESVMQSTQTQETGADFEKVVEEKEVEINALKDNQQQLVDKLTIAQIELDFERIYNIIFASQIELLAKLGVNSPVDISYIMSHYSGVQRVNRKAFKDWTVDQYIAYLLRVQLIELNDFKVSITSKGRAFISYLGRMNYRKYDL